MEHTPVFPSGDLMSEADKTPVTAPVPLPVVFCQIRGQYTATDRKLWLLLLHLEWDNLTEKSGNGKWHDVSESDLIRIFSKHSGDKNIDRIWESAKRLADTRVTYERIDENDERWEGVTSLFHAEYKRKNKRNGQFRFMFPPPLIPILIEPGRFARLRVAFLLKLDSKYAITLYQVLETIANMREPTIEATVDQIRGWLKVPDGKLSQWAFFYRRALKPAINEINANPDLSGIHVTHELIRQGKGGKVQRVKFTVTKAATRIDFERGIQTTKKAKESAKVARLIPAFKGTAIYEKVKKYANGLDVHALEAEWRKWVADNDIAVEKPEAHFMDFVKRRAETKK